MKVSVTPLRSDIYNRLDRVLETGEPLEVERRGQVVRVVPPARTSLWERFPPRPDLVVGDPDDLVRVDWSSEWTP